MNKQVINFLKSGKVEEIPDFSKVKEAVLNYPYFQGLLFYYLKSLYLHKESDFQPELKRLAPFITDRKSFFYTVFSEEYAVYFQKTGKTELPGDRTAILLDSFFDQLDDRFPKTGESLDESLLSSSIVTMDYFSYLEKTQDENNHFPNEDPTADTIPSLRHHDIIDSFIEKSDNGEDFKLKMLQAENADSKETVIPQAEEETLDDSMFFTETLSRIYIKQKKYEKAYKIIKQLSLNYPEKNTYFADQIRFLEKLMMNSSKNGKQQL